jgi:GTP cyclohydrolase I
MLEFINKRFGGRKMVDDCNDPLALAADLFCEEEMDLDSIENSVLNILKAIGEDPERQGLVRTPERVARSYQELFEGYRMDPKALINEAVFDIAYDEMVIVRDIEFSSMCEHHMLPFMGRVHVAYVPSEKVIGLSKIPRIVDLFSKRLQVQERMTKQIADFIDVVLKPQGVAVVVEGLHMCMMLRGVKKHDARMTTSAMLGSFRENMSTRMEFLDNISRGATPLHI